MKQKFFIPGKLPGANDITKANRSHWSIGSKQKKDVQKLICWHIKKAKLKPMKQIYIKYFWFEPNKKRDLDNITAAQKFINDSLVEMRIIENDGWDFVKGLWHHFEIKKDKESIGVFVELDDEPKSAMAFDYSVEEFFTA